MESSTIEDWTVFPKKRDSVLLLPEMLPKSLENSNPIKKYFNHFSSQQQKSKRLREIYFHLRRYSSRSGFYSAGMKIILDEILDSFLYSIAEVKEFLHRRIQWCTTATITVLYFFFSSKTKNDA